MGATKPNPAPGNYVNVICRLQKAGLYSQDETPPIATTAESAENQANSLLFQKFPTEIRRKVLREAFGSRVVHIVHWRKWHTGIFFWTGGQCTNPVLHQVRLYYVLGLYLHIR